MKHSVVVVCGLILCSTAEAGLPNEPRIPGQLISKSHTELGRLAIMELLGDYVIAIPEIPSSPAGSDYLVRALDISSPENPVTVATFGQTRHPGMAHGTYKRGNEVYIGGWPNNAVRLEDDGSLSYVAWSGPNAHWNKSGANYPWSATMWWSYNAIEGLAWLSLEGQITAEWDHLGVTGVIGAPTFMGNLMIYASDQSRSGMATYDVSDPHNPALLDVFNLPAVHPILKDTKWVDGALRQTDLEYGLGGYWSEVYGHYMVFARRDNNPGIQIVDFSDPSNIRLHCEVLYKDPANGLTHLLQGNTNDPMYLGFQDEYVFSEKLKVNIETCEVELVLDEMGAGIETGQYSRPIGNLLLTGGGPNYLLVNQGIAPGGLGIWAHQAAPDTRPPFVAYHIPRANQTNYPVMAPISLMIPETLRTENLVVGENLSVTEVGGEPVEIDYLLSHTGILTVDPLQNLKPDTTYEVRLVGIEDAMHNPMEEYTFLFSTGDAINGTQEVITTPQNHAPVINVVNVSPNQTVLVNDPVRVSVAATDIDGNPLEYRFRRSEGATYSAWSTGASISYTYDQAASYTITAQVRDGSGATATAIANVMVAELPETEEAALVSSQMARSRDGSSVWAVNPDNGTVSQLAVNDHRLLDEVAVGDDPRSVAVDDNDNLWVTLRDADAVVILDTNGNVIQQLALGYGAAPEGIVMNRDGSIAYVALYGTGRILKIATQDRTILGEARVAPTVTALAITSDGGRLLATRYISPQNWGEVWDINTASMTVLQTIQLAQNTAHDDIDNGRGVPNSLSSILIDGQDKFAYVVGKKDNTGRGILNGNDDLDDDNTVRTFAAKIDLATGRESPQERIDFDNADSPSALALSPGGNYLFASLQGNNQVVVLSRNPATGTLGNTVSKLATGLAPQGLLLDSATQQLFVKNFTGRSVTVVDVSGLLIGNVANPAIANVSTVTREVLSQQVLRGKQIFYNASYGLHDEGVFTGQISAEGYLSCATCHQDGGQDGRVYDFTGRGEGLRNNISLNGSAGTLFGNLHWSGNFDEVQDFELDIRRRFLGRGLMNDSDFAATEHPFGPGKAGYSEDLDALAAYVSSLDDSALDHSPWRASNGGLTPAGASGEQIFTDLGCQGCHEGPSLSDGELHDVGTLREYSGSRLGEPLPGIMTPSLLGLFNTAPYLHDGSAGSLADVFSSVGGDVVQAENASLTGTATVVVPGDFSYLRRGAGVIMNRDGAVSVVTRSNQKRTAYVRVRYGSVAVSTQLLLAVKDRRYSVPLELLPTANGEDVAFQEVIFRVQFDKGNNKLTVSPQSSDPGATVVIDDLTISTEENEGLARVHTIVNEMDQRKQLDLFLYLMQLDRDPKKVQSLDPEVEQVIVGC